MIPVRQSTAFETAIGPILDADGVAVTGGVVGDFKIKKTTGNFAALNGSATLTHVSAGVYDLVLTTSDTDTVGLCCVAIDDTTNACASLYLQVMEEAVYDALYAASATGAFPGITEQLPSSPVKNTAFTYVIKMVDGTDNVTPETGLTVTMTRSLDGAAFGSATGTVSEISTGHYKVEASAADMNGDVVAHRFTASGAADLTIVFKTVS